MSNPFDMQVDGSHYTDLKIQPFQLAYAVADGDAGFCKLAKYITRKKGDTTINLQKAAHVCSMRKGVDAPVRNYALTPAQFILVHDFAAQTKHPDTVYTILDCYLQGNMLGAVMMIWKLKLHSDADTKPRMYFGRAIK